MVFPVMFVFAASYAASEQPVEALACPNAVSAWTHVYGRPDLRDIAADRDGNVVVVGFFRWTTDFDPTDGVDEHTSNGNDDAFVTKLHGDGSYAWTYTVGGPDGMDQATGLAVDSDGSIVAVGGFCGTVDFDPGPGIDEHTSLGDVAAFVTRLDPGGRHLWTVSFGGSGEAIVQGVALDGDGNILLVGFFDGEVDFDPGPGHDWEWGSADVFVTKLGPDGSYHWTHTIGSSAFDAGEAIGVDSDGNIYATGTFRGTVDFDPTSGVDEHVMVAPYEDIFVTKYYPDGSYAWTRTYDTGYPGSGGDMAVGPDGGPVIASLFSGTVDFDPTDGVDERTAVYSLDDRSDLLVTKLNADGSYAWTYTAGGASQDVAHALTLDEAGNVLVTGAFRETVDFDPGDGVDLHVTGWNNGIFLSKLGLHGTYHWTRTFGPTNSNASGKHIATDPLGAVVTAGLFAPAPPQYADFDPGCEVHLQDPVSDSGSTRFVTKLVCPELTADLDGDGSVDLWDFAQFQRCFTDEGPTTCGDGCSRLDLDPDDDIDLSDFLDFKAALTGPHLLGGRTGVHQCAAGLVR